MIERILIGVNDSDPSDQAVEVGLGLAKQLNARVALIHVVDATVAVAPVLADAGTGFPMVSHPAVVAPAAIGTSVPDEGTGRLAGERLLAHARQSIGEINRPMEFLREGKPVDEILATAKEWRADLIVLGTHGRRAIAHLLMGSTSEAVLRGAECPVMLVQAKAN